ncbi:MCE family protein [Streptomyces polyrhachis]|uniref:MCE family protein n=1 Tax=Streptomyces polyrhachis TaxID=1282885 RepID=A0ABW2GHB4_9ACTN
MAANRFAGLAARHGMRRIVAVAVVLTLLAAGAVQGLQRLFGEKDGMRITAVFDKAIAVHPGSDVRILGVPAGEVEKVEPSGTQVKVTLRVDKGVKVPLTVRAVVVAPSVVSGRFIQLSPPYQEGQAMQEGGEIPRELTAAPVEVDDLTRSVTDLVRALGPGGVNQDGALSRFLDVGAKNLKGNGKYVNDTIQALGGASAVLNGHSAELVRAIQELAKFVAMLKRNDGQIGKATQQIADVTTFLAADREELAAALSQLGTALGEIKVFIADNRGRLKGNVDKLAKVTDTLVKQRKSIAEALDTLPLAGQNIENAINPKTNRINGRANILEALRLTTSPRGALAPVTEEQARTLPALPLPSVGGLYGTTGDTQEGAR